MNTADLLQQQAKTIQRQWQALKLATTSSLNNDSAWVINAELVLNQKLKLALSAVVAHGLREDISTNLVLNAALPDPISFSHSALPLAAFINQATALLTPLTLILDLQTERLLIQQSQIMANSIPLDSRPFLNILEVVTPLVQGAVKQLIQQESSPENARLMANFMAEQYYGAISA